MYLFTAFVRYVAVLFVISIVIIVFMAFRSTNDSNSSNSTHITAEPDIPKVRSVIFNHTDKTECTNPKPNVRCFNLKATFLKEKAQRLTGDITLKFEIGEETRILLNDSYEPYTAHTLHEALLEAQPQSS